MFAGRYVKLDTALETQAIEVTVSPGLVYVDPGDSIPIEATIDHAETPTLAWDPGAGTWADTTGQDTNGPDRRTLTVPTSRSAFPFTVRVESTSTTGLRRDRTPERAGQVIVQLRPFFVSASPDEIRPGETSILTAYDLDDEPVEVTWSRFGGRVTETDIGAATFTADEPGKYVVTATDARGESVSVTIHVLGGECSFSYTIGGTRFIGQDGDVVTWSDKDDDESRLLVGDPTGEGYGAQLTFTSEEGVRVQGEGVTGVGAYFIRFATFEVARDSLLGASVSNTGEAEITVFEDGALIAGEGAGEVVGDGGRIPFSIEFSVFDSGEHNFGAADFECYIDGPPTDD
jgi:hypothetical protein